MIHILENVFNQHNLKNAQSWSAKLPTDDTWFDIDDLDSFARKLVIIGASQYSIPMNDIIGCEMHLNHNTPMLHYDKDEKLYETTGKLSFPLCGIVWYPMVDMIGGELVFPDAGVTVKPSTNMLVIFNGWLLHDGKPFTGIRKSVGINPWSKKPLTYQ